MSVRDAAEALLKVVGKLLGDGSVDADLMLAAAALLMQLREEPPVSALMAAGEAMRAELEIAYDSRAITPGDRRGDAISKALQGWLAAIGEKGVAAVARSERVAVERKFQMKRLTDVWLAAEALAENVAAGPPEGATHYRVSLAAFDRLMDALKGDHVP